MTESSLEIISDLYDALRVMLAVFPIRDGEPGDDMHVETLAHEKAGAAMQRAEMFNHAFYQQKASSNVPRFYPGIDGSGTIPRATMNEDLTGDYVRYEDYAALLGGEGTDHYSLRCAGHSARQISQFSAISHEKVR